MEKLRLVLQRDASMEDDFRPRWLTLHSIVITEDMTQDMLRDTLEILQTRINSSMGRI